MFANKLFKSDKYLGTPLKNSTVKGEKEDKNVDVVVFITQVMTLLPLT